MGSKGGDIQVERICNMTDVSFQDILNMPADQIEAPKALPVGTYVCIVDGQPEYAKIGKNNTDCVNFMLKPVQAMQDVDQSQLAEVLNGSSLQDKKVRHRLFVTKDSSWRLKQFLNEHLGIPLTSLGQMVPEAMGKQVMVTLGHQAADDGVQIYQTVKATAKV